MPRALLGVLLAGSLLTGVAGCGGDEDGPEELEFGTEGGDLSPEDVRAPDSEVAAGLGELKGYATQVADGLPSNSAEALDAQERLLPIWESILGTVKANDADAFDTLSEAFAFLISATPGASADTLRAAAESVRSTADAYLRAHPVSATASPTSLPE